VDYVNHAKRNDTPTALQATLFYLSSRTT